MGTERRGKYEAPLHEALTSTRRRAAEAGMQCDLTEDDITDMFTGICEISGVPVKFEQIARQVGTGHTTKNTASVDRIDSTKGYTAANIQWTHIHVNIAKSTLTLPQFITMCRRVAENNTGVPDDNTWIESRPYRTFKLREYKAKAVKK